MFATILIVVGISIALVAVTYMAWNREQSLLKPNYKMWFALGLVFIFLGIGTGNPATLILAVGLVVAALSRKSEWG